MTRPASHIALELPNVLRAGTGAVGADLDLTLIDSRKATAVAIECVNRDCSTQIDVEDLVAHLGLPIRTEFARYMPEAELTQAVEVFRTAFLREGLAHLTPLPGALDLADILQRHPVRRLVVVTSRIPRIASACLDACAIPVAALAGGLTGRDKAPAIRDHDIDVYVGDHVLDIEAAHEAAVPGVGVTTGNHTAHELRAAGAEFVVSSLAELISALS